MTFTDRPLRGILTGILTGALALTIAPPGGGGTADVIVRGTNLAAVSAAVTDLGGDIELEIGLINAVSASVPSGLVDALSNDPRVTDVSVDAPVQLANTTDARMADTQAAGRAPVQAAREIGGAAMLNSPYDGDGVDVAIIDSGVADVRGMERVQHAIDLSLGDETGRDSYGHGTVMASILGFSSGNQRGISPNAGIIDVKVADENGLVDISQILAGIDWVVSNRNTDGRNIRVLSLSFGTDGKNAYASSPMAYAVEAAWRHGIVVVVAAGNHGDSLGRLSSPAIDPHVISVGALDLGTSARIGDETVPAWSAKGDGVRNPDVIAPGRSIFGASSPGSAIETQNPDAREGMFIRGSGTSHATAFTAGIVANMLEANPSLTPDQVKRMLVSTAYDLTDVPATKDGAGAINLNRLFPNGELMAAPGARAAHQNFAYSDGTGSLDGDRGSFILEDANGRRLTGEQTVLGKFDRDAWAGSTWSGSTWSGSTWSGSTWSGSTWSGSTWSGSTWSSALWGE